MPPNRASATTCDGVATRGDAPPWRLYDDVELVGDRWAHVRGGAVGDSIRPKTARWGVFTDGIRIVGDAVVAPDPSATLGRRAAVGDG